MDNIKLKKKNNPSNFCGKWSGTKKELNRIKEELDKDRKTFKTKKINLD